MNHSLTMLLCLSLLSGPLALQKATAADAAAWDGAVEEIIVTARRRDENINDVPIAVSTVGGTMLEDIGAHDIRQIAASIPNFTLAQGQGQSTTAAIFIRGVGQNDSLQTFEQGVALYVDGVPYPRMQGTVLKLFDIAAVEVLRGPQGTLYGKNAVGGAVNILTKSPDVDPGSRLEILYGRKDHKQVSGYMALPLVDDKLYVSLSGLWSKRDGYYTDKVTGTDFANDDSLSLRAKAVFKASDSLSITVAADLNQADLALPAHRAESSIIITDLVFGPVEAAAAPTAPFDGDIALSVSEDPGETLDSQGVAMTLDWQVSDAVAVTSITAYRKTDTTIWWDLDGTRNIIADIRARWFQDQISQELQLSVEQDRWDAILGAFYLREESDAAQRSFLNELVQVAGQPLNVENPGDDILRTRSYALYGHVNYGLSPTLDISAGLRWSEDKKVFHRSSRSEIGGVEVKNFIFDGRSSWSSVTPSVSLTYKATENHTAYARVAKGYRSGGFNGRTSSPADAAPFKPETVWSYETGLKSTLGDRNVSSRLAAFYNTYKNFQARISRFADPANPSAGFDFPTVNAATLEMYGLEWDVEATLGPLAVQANIGLLKSKYGAFFDDTGDRSDNEPIFSPKLTAGLSAFYTLGLGGRGSVTIGGQASYRSGYYVSVTNLDTLYENGYVKIDVTARWDLNDHFYLTAGVKNLTDEIALMDGLEFTSIANIQTGYYGEPRSWYMGAGLTF